MMNADSITAENQENDHQFMTITLCAHIQVLQPLVYAMAIPVDLLFPITNLLALLLGNYQNFKFIFLKNVEINA